MVCLWWHSGGALVCARGGLYNLLKLNHLWVYLVVAGVTLNAGMNCRSMRLMVGAGGTVVAGLQFDPESL